MIRFTPLEEWHIPLIQAQEVQARDQAFHIAQNAIPDLVKNSFSLCCWIDDECVGAAGVRPIWQGRAAAWALLGRNSRPAMVAIVKKLRFVLATMPVNRIEMTVQAEFGPGCRLAALLGFEREARLPGFFPDGSTAYLFTRLKHV
jgi:hypothetical protein